MQRVGLGGTVVYALRTCICPILYAKAALTPFQTLAPCSGAVFKTLAAMGYSTGPHCLVKPVRYCVRIAFLYGYAERADEVFT